MSKAAKPLEFNSLTPEQKWRYLSAYWRKASKFYDLKQELIISEEETRSQIRKLKTKPQSNVRQVIPLKDWRWRLDPKVQGVREGYFKHDCADGSWQTVTIPHVVNFTPSDPVEFGKIDAPWFNFPSRNKPTTIYVGEYAAWYRASVRLTKKELEGKRAFIKFESCSIKTTCWVDEWPVIMGHYGVYPFEAEVTEELLKSMNDEKQISLQVVSTPSNTPDLFYNCLEYAYVERRGDKIFESKDLNWGGINGAVEIVITSPTYIKDLFVFTKTIEEDMAKLQVRLEVENTTRDLFEGKVTLEISKWYPVESPEREKFTIDVRARPLSTTIVEREIALSIPVLWESWNPNLYLVHATLSDEHASHDDVYETFGVRIFTSKDNGFLLNGKPIVLSATHDQGMYPDTPPTCPGDYWIVQDILLHKALGMVAARYPSDNRVHYRRIAEYADQMGLMLVWEGYCSLWTQNPDIMDLARRDVERLIRDLRNHPSVIVWTLGDEIFYYDPADSVYQNKRSHYVELVHEVATICDPSRLIVPVGHWVEDLVLMIETLIGRGLSVDDARRRSLEMQPIFTSPNVYWAIHSLPSGADNKPVYDVMRRYQRILCGAGKAVTFDEFGCEGMPNWDLCKEEWWHNRWTFNPVHPSGKKFLEPELIGRELSVDDWQVSQAYQASVFWRILSFIRENEAFAGFSNCFMRDVLNYYNGLVDARGRGKLAFFLFKNMLGRFFISGMHGNYLFKLEDQMSIMISNNGSRLNRGRLTVRIADDKGTVLDEKIMDDLSLNQGLTGALNYELKDLPNGLYTVEYYLNDDDGNELGRSLDMFFID